MSESEGKQPSFKKTRIIKEDGRYLIYYSFVEEGEEEVSPSEGEEKVGHRPADDAGDAGRSGKR